MRYNSALIKKCEEAIETNLSTIKSVAEGKGFIPAIEFMQELDKNLEEDDITNRFAEINFNLKIAFYNKGFILRRWTLNDGKRVFEARYKTSEDNYPKSISDLNCKRLILTKDVIKIMEDLNNLTAKDDIERGFFLLYGEDCRIFPTNLHTGENSSMSSPPIPTEGYVIFGFFHTHPSTSEEDKEYKKLLTKYNVNIMPSHADVLVTISDYLDEKEFNHSAMIILSSLDNKGFVLIPRKNIPDITYKNFYEILSEKRAENIISFYNIVLDLFYISSFYVPFEGDIVIEYSNGDYKLEGVKK